ncbi:MAG: hypothetical protein GY940_30275, partial [bacterium]|nr:hypothetical protein [bacterium]
TATYCDGSTVDIYPFSFVTRTDGSTFNSYDVLVSPIPDGLRYGFEDKDDADYDDIIVELWVTGNNTSNPVAHIRYVSKEASYKHWMYVVYSGLQSLVFKAEEASPGAVFDIPLPIKTCADFEISAAPAVQTILQGEATSYTVSLTALNGFNSPVNLSLSGLPANAAGTFTMNPVTPAPGAESILNITTTTDTPAGTYNLTITGAGGEKNHTAQVTLKVNEKPPEPDFSISAAPASQQVIQGESTSYT